MYALLSNKRSQNSIFFFSQIHEDCVAMETELCILNKEFNMSGNMFNYAILVRHYYANIVWFLFNLCQYENGWDLLLDFWHV